jgi:hypothetical protein
MLEYIGIIIGIVCIIALIGLGYFLYSKSSKQQEVINQLILKHRAIESALFRPPPHHDVNALYTDQLDTNCDECTLQPYNESSKNESVESKSIEIPEQNDT